MDGNLQQPGIVRLVSPAQNLHEAIRSEKEKKFDGAKVNGWRRLIAGPYGVPVLNRPAKTAEIIGDLERFDKNCGRTIVGPLPVGPAVPAGRLHPMPAAWPQY